MRQTKTGIKIIIASNGTFSDWCYDVWASWNFDKAHEHTKSLFGDIVDVTTSSLKVELEKGAKENLKNTCFNSSATSSDSATNSQLLKLTKLTVSDLGLAISEEKKIYKLAKQ